MIRSNPKLIAVFQVLVSVLSLRRSSAWTATTTRLPLRRSFSPFTSLYDAEEAPGGGGGPEPEMDRKQKMAVVRELQSQFYKNNDFTVSSFDQSSGIIYNLPLWRVPWTELPGRSNMLNVHDPIYTNMFESILYNEKPWYIGHLFLPEGSQNLKSREKMHTLKSWKEEMEDEGQEQPRSAVVGTLLKVADYRRMEDGRLLLLVEGLERFVVTAVKQELPYSVADVQLLPDTEEVDPDLWVDSCTEGEIREARSLALAESFQRYHPYEYDENFELPVPDKPDLQVQDIHGSMLTLVLPYVPLSKTADLSELKEKPLELMGENQEDIPQPPSQLDDGIIICQDFEEECQIGGVVDHSEVQDEQACLEKQLLEAKVLMDFTHPDPSVMDLSPAELEYRLWIAMNDFLKSTKTPVSPILLGLLPEGIDWPSNFYLRKIANDIANKTDMKHKYVQISMDLPSHRRLRRLSFSASKILEGKPGMEGLRQKLLETASTKSRLAMILDKLESFDNSLIGKFE